MAYNTQNAFAQKCLFGLTILIPIIFSVFVLLKYYISDPKLAFLLVATAIFLGAFIYYFFLVQQLKKTLDISQKILGNTEISALLEVQQAMLPTNFKELIAGYPFDIYGKLYAANELAGDFYELLELDEEKLCCIIGDVCGKGLPAFALMTQVKATIKTLLRKDKAQLPEILANANNLLIDNNYCFTTLIIGILNKRSAEFSYCSAGHLPIAHYQASENNVVFLEKPSRPLGLKKNVEYSINSIQLQPGDNITLYTDGITESKNKFDEEFSEVKLEVSILGRNQFSSEQLLNDLLLDARQFSKHTSVADDMTALNIKYLDLDHRLNTAPENINFDFSFSVDASMNIHAAQIEAKSYLLSQKISAEIAHDVSVILEELITNIRNYAFDDTASGRINIEITTDTQTLILRISDSGSPFDPTQILKEKDIPHLFKDRLGGRGLVIIQNLMSELSYNYYRKHNVLTLKKNLAN